MRHDTQKIRRVDMGYNVAIDGPAGAGKSTVAREAAARLSFIYVDTGAMYRALALFAIRNGIDFDDEEQIAACCCRAAVEIAFDGGRQHVLLNGEDVTGLIREEEVSRKASVVSAVRQVREHLLKLQRELAASRDVLMDGRDIGTCILPNADVKIYLTASSLVRAKRRLAEQLEKGEHLTLEEVQHDIEERDRRDMNRTVSPLRKADDAVLIDTSDMSISEAVDAVCALVEERKAAE